MRTVDLIILLAVSIAFVLAEDETSTESTNSDKTSKIVDDRLLTSPTARSIRRDEARSLQAAGPVSTATRPSAIRKWLSTFLAKIKNLYRKLAIKLKLKKVTPEGMAQAQSKQIVVRQTRHDEHHPQNVKKLQRKPTTDNVAEPEPQKEPTIDNVEKPKAKKKPTTESKTEAEPKKLITDSVGELEPQKEPTIDNVEKPKAKKKPTTESKTEAEPKKLITDIVMELEPQKEPTIDNVEKTKPQKKLTTNNVKKPKPQEKPTTESKMEAEPKEPTIDNVVEPKPHPKPTTESNMEPEMQKKPTTENVVKLKLPKVVTDEVLKYMVESGMVLKEAEKKLEDHKHLALKFDVMASDYLVKKHGEWLKVMKPPSEVEVEIRDMRNRDFSNRKAMYNRAITRYKQAYVELIPAKSKAVLDELLRRGWTKGKSKKKAVVHT